MATVQSLSTALKKTSDEVIEILVNAGIEGKTANSEISGDERKILMVLNLNLNTTCAITRLSARFA
jgi:hypothetical protein